MRRTKRNPTATLIRRILVIILMITLWIVLSMFIRRGLAGVTRQCTETVSGSITSVEKNSIVSRLVNDRDKGRYTLEFTYTANGTEYSGETEYKGKGTPGVGDAINVSYDPGNTSNYYTEYDDPENYHLPYMYLVIPLITAAVSIFQRIRGR